MSVKKLVIFGVGHAGELAHHYFTRDGGRNVAGFTVDRAFLTATTFCGLPVVPFEEVAAVFPPSEYDLFVAVGYAKVNQVRALKFEEAKAKGYVLASYCSSHATVLHGEPLGENCFIVEGVVIQPFARIGRNVTIWAGFIGHHAVIADHCFIAGYVAGGVKIGPHAFVGVHAILRTDITVGASSVIGSGALVMADVPPGAVLRATPAELSPVPSHRLTHL